MSLGGGIPGGIRLLQSQLNSSGALQVTLKETGEMGPQTVKALRAFQAGNNLKVTGKADRPTLQLLSKAGGKPKRAAAGPFKGEITALEPQFKAIRALIGRGRKAAAAHDQIQREMQKKLQSVGDDAQLANINLQNMLQKQQQAMQMMSNISKMLHDTATAVIRKIG
jgi:peptidoglycan hydrolase-like protein with peptidoglycan-binding domain